jgi:hypothetical protein
MTLTPDQPARRSDAAPAITGLAAWSTGGGESPVVRHLAGFEPRNAWRLKGTGDEPDEIVVPGILLDDFGRSASIEAVMSHALFCQVQAMAALAELRMVEARTGPKPRRLRPEANVWLVEGTRREKRLDIAAVVALDRVHFGADRHVRADSMAFAEIVPGEKAWR